MDEPLLEQRKEPELGMKKIEIQPFRKKRKDSFKMRRYNKVTIVILFVNITSVKQ